MVPLNTKLATNDQVQILVSKSRQYPKRDWVNFVVAPSTKANIRKGLREQERVHAIDFGRKKLLQEMKSKNMYEHDIENFLEENINRIKVKDLSEAYERVGHGLLSIDKVMDSLFPKKVSVNPTKSPILSSNTSKIAIEGQIGIKTLIAKCCSPIEGDKIVALITNS